MQATPMRWRRMEKVDTIVVDKTGTLTEGHPELVTVDPRGRIFRERTSCALAAGVETSSEHPLAAAIVRCGRRNAT